MKNNNRNKKVCLGIAIFLVTCWSLLIPMSNASPLKVSATQTLNQGQEWSVSYGQIPEGDTIRVSVTVTNGQISQCGILDSDNRDDFLAARAVYWRAGYGSSISSTWSDTYVVHDTDTYYFCAVSYSGSVTFTYTITRDSVAQANLIEYIIVGVSSAMFLAVALIINKFNFTGSIKTPEGGK